MFCLLSLGQAYTGTRSPHGGILESLGTTNTQWVDLKMELSSFFQLRYWRLQQMPGTCLE